MNFSLMYMIGAFVRKYEINEKLNSKIKISGIILVSIIIIFFWAIIDNMMTGTISKASWSYCNPFVVLEAFCVFILFLNINGKVKVINLLAKGVFSVFLLHGYFIGKVGIEKYVQEAGAVMILHMVVSSIVIFLICLLIHFVYASVSKPIFSWIFSKHDSVVVDLEDEDEA